MILVPCFLVGGILFGQSSSIADSLVYAESQVFAFKNGELYRAYPIGYHYPLAAVEAGVMGVMSYSATMTEGCTVEAIEYQNSLGPIFEESIAKSVKRIAYIFRAFKYENCAEAVIKETLNFDL